MKKKPDWKIIVILILIGIAFLSAVIFIMDRKLAENIDNNDSSSVAVSESLLDGTTSEKISDVVSNTENSIEPEIYFDMPVANDRIIEIDFAKIENLSQEQSTDEAKLKLAQLLKNATLGKNIKIISISDSSDNEKVIADVYFTSGIVYTYVVMFDNYYENNFIRCVSKEVYDDIMNGGNV